MGIFSSFLNAMSQQETNLMNYTINRMNNAANYQLAKKQNDWNVAQWERENEYNSARSQVQRFLDAGLNPNLVDGAGSASSLTSAPLANQVPATLNPVVTDFDLINTGIALEDLKLRKLKTEKEAEKTGAETKKIYQDTQQAFEMFPFLKDTAQWQEKSAASQAHVDEASVQYRIREMYLNTEVRNKVLTLTDEQINEVRQRCDLIAKQASREEKENIFRQLEIDFSKKMGFPLNSAAGQLLLGYICDSRVVQTKIKGELSGGIGFNGFGIKAGGSVEQDKKDFKNPLSE